MDFGTGTRVDLGMHQDWIKALSEPPSPQRPYAPYLHTAQCSTYLMHVGACLLCFRAAHPVGFCISGLVVMFCQAGESCWVMQSAYK